MTWLAGWKTYLGAALVASTAVLHALEYDELAASIEAVGLALGITGLRAKQERITPG